MIMFFYKIFKCEKYLDDFLDGKLYINTISYFRDIDSKESDGRGDDKEGISALIKAKDIENITLYPTIEGVKVGEIIFKEGLVESTMYFDCNLYSHILCLSAENGQKYDEKLLKERIKSICNSKSNNPLGNHIVLITQPEEFYLRLKAEAEKQNIFFDKGLVEYYDDENSKIFKTFKESVFSKGSIFYDQKEYRFTFKNIDDKDKPFKLEVGSIKDIAVVGFDNISKLIT